MIESITMNRISKVFENKASNKLAIYFTAGFPELDSTTKILKLLSEENVDLIEIGMPYSDPLADGPVIQQSSMKALKNGMSIEVLFQQLKDMRKYSEVPVILMGYLNPVLQYGVEAFCKKAREAGVDGFILPDLPIDEYISRYKPTFEAYGLSVIYLITPQSGEERIRMIDENTSGFIYVVSSSSTTGSSLSVQDEQKSYFEKIKNMGLKNPTMIGFGISDAQAFRDACSYTSGAIVGSAFIKAIESAADLDSAARDFVKKIKA